MKVFGGVDYDEAYFIQQTSDSGYILAGVSWPFDTQEYDFLVIKLSSNGALQWAKKFNGEKNDYVCMINQTNDDGYILVGSTNSFGGNDYDILIMKMSSDGTLQWARILGGEADDYAGYIQQTNDGGYIIGGSTHSFGTNYFDFLIIKLSSSGTLEWAKIIGGNGNDYGAIVQPTYDGGYIMVGHTQSFGASNWDILVIKLFSDGNIEYSKIFGGWATDLATSFIYETSDSGYILGGWTYSFGIGNWDFLVIKTQDGQMAPDCPWYDCNPTIISPPVFVDSPSITFTLPTLTNIPPLISSTSPSISTFDICTPAAQENIYFLEETVKFETSNFFKDKISLMFPVYSKDRIKLVLYDISGKEIISKSFEFNNYVEIKDKRIEKIKRGIYFLKVYLKGREIRSLKMIKE